MADMEKTVAANEYNAAEIQVLEGLEAVRKRPGMYIGSVSTKGLNHLIYEIVDNAVDEHLAGYCSKIPVILEKDGSATVSDNGRGIPVGMHEKGISAERLVFTTLHAGGKFDNAAYKTSGGLHGVGSSVVIALLIPNKKVVIELVIMATPFVLLFFSLRFSLYAFAFSSLYLLDSEYICNVHH